MTQAPKRICITGAGGQIGYNLMFSVARGDVFGPSTPVILHLLDVPAVMESLQGTMMELQDCAFPTLKGVVATDKLDVAFKDIDVCLMVGAMPRKEGMERKDLLAANAGIFKVQGKALDDYASRDVKVLVVGNPANTNCLLAMQSAPNIPKHNFSCLTRLDMNRALSQVATKVDASVSDVKNVIIWGNHSNTQYPDVSHGVIVNFPKHGTTTAIKAAVNDAAWIEEFIKIVQNRGAAVIKARKASSAASASKAICDHVRDWLVGTAPGEYVSMGVVSDGSYGVPEGLVYSFPVTCSGGRWSIVQGLTIDEFSRKKMDETAKELMDERATAMSL